jgi:hypothetical protein
MITANEARKNQNSFVEDEAQTIEVSIKQASKLGLSELIINKVINQENFDLLMKNKFEVEDFKGTTIIRW